MALMVANNILDFYHPGEKCLTALKPAINPEITMSTNNAIAT